MCSISVLCAEALWCKAQGILLTPALHAQLQRQGQLIQGEMSGPQCTVAGWLLLTHLTAWNVRPVTLSASQEHVRFTITQQVYIPDSLNIHVISCATIHCLVVSQIGMI